MPNLYQLNRKKVMKLASKLYREGTSYEACLKLMVDTYPSLSAEAVSSLAAKLYRVAGKWGKVQSIAWKMHKHHIKQLKLYIDAIQKDPEFSARPKYYTEPVEDWKPKYGFTRRPNKEVIYTQAYGKVELTPFLAKALELK